MENYKVGHFSESGTESKLELLMRCHKGGGAAPPPRAAPPRLGDQQARQVDAVREEQSIQRRRGFSSTILTLGADEEASKKYKTLLGQ